MSLTQEQLHTAQLMLQVRDVERLRLYARQIDLRTAQYQAPDPFAAVGGLREIQHWHSWATTKIHQHNAAIDAANERRAEEDATNPKTISVGQLAWDKWRSFRDDRDVFLKKFDGPTFWLPYFLDGQGDPDSRATAALTAIKAIESPAGVEDHQAYINKLHGAWQDMGGYRSWLENSAADQAWAMARVVVSRVHDLTKQLAELRAEVAELKAAGSVKDVADLFLSANTSKEKPHAA